MGCYIIGLGAELSTTFSDCVCVRGRLLLFSVDVACFVTFAV